MFYQQVVKDIIAKQTAEFIRDYPKEEGDDQYVAGTQLEYIVQEFRKQYADADDVVDRTNEDLTLSLAEEVFLLISNGQAKATYVNEVMCDFTVISLV